MGKVIRASILVLVIVMPCVIQRIGSRATSNGILNCTVMEVEWKSGTKVNHFAGSHHRKAMRLDSEENLLTLPPREQSLPCVVYIRYPGVERAVTYGLFCE